jgi:hypothetical protein
LGAEKGVVLPESQAVPVQAKIIKNTKDNLQDAITNFDELRVRYADTAFYNQYDEVVIYTGDQLNARLNRLRWKIQPPERSGVS